MLKSRTAAEKKAIMPAAAHRPSLRSSMPFTAAVIDDYRAEFGVREIDAEIKAGMRGEPRFYASEAGHVLGKRYIPDVVVSGEQLMLSFEVEEAGAKQSKRGKWR